MSLYYFVNNAKRDGPVIGMKQGKPNIHTKSKRYSSIETVTRGPIDAEFFFNVYIFLAYLSSS